MIATVVGPPRPHTRFSLPDSGEAGLPPERRGVARDHVRLLVASPAGMSHRLFCDLPTVLDAGDLVVINTSATLPAALTAQRGDGTHVLVHVSDWFDDERWVVEVRRQGNDGADLGAAPGDALRLAGGVTIALEHPYPDTAARASRLWVATVRPGTHPVAYLHTHGRPIAYRHLSENIPLADHQTVYAGEPGSAEMPSAGRPFTTDLLARLVAAGITVAPLTLHAGVSSPEYREPPAPERYSVPESTARLVASTHRAGKRVVAVGTTVVRALETVAVAGAIAGGTGRTDLVLGPSRQARVVTGLITGLHTPESSHLLLLEAVAGPRLVADAYRAAVDLGYLWHEFGDSMLFLP